MMRPTNTIMSAFLSQVEKHKKMSVASYRDKLLPAVFIVSLQPNA